MRKYIFYIIIGLIVTIVVIISNLEKGFYEYTKSDSDLYRIPLIKPYEINSGDPLGRDWTAMNKSLITFSGYSFGVHVDSVTLNNNLIIMYTNEIVSTNGNYEAWLIFDTVEKKGYIFKKRQEFLNQLKKHNINTFKFYDPESIFKEYSTTLRLPNEWQPYITR